MIRWLGHPRGHLGMPAKIEKCKLVVLGNRRPANVLLEQSQGQESEPSFQAPRLATRGDQQRYLGQKPGKREAQFYLFFIQL